MNEKIEQYRKDRDAIIESENLPFGDPPPDYTPNPEKMQELIKENEASIQVYKDKCEAEILPYKSQLIKIWESTSFADIFLDRTIESGIPKKIALSFYLLKANQSKSVMPLK